VLVSRDAIGRPVFPLDKSTIIITTIMYMDMPEMYVSPQFEGSANIIDAKQLTSTLR
jgi:hypothetical protein